MKDILFEMSPEELAEQAVLHARYIHTLDERVDALSVAIERARGLAELRALQTTLTALRADVAAAHDFEQRLQFAAARAIGGVQ